MNRESATRSELAFIGLGAIGLPMAARLSDAGWGVIGVEPDPARAGAARAAGIELAGDVASAAARADRFVVCVVRSADQLEAVLLGPDGAFAAAPGCCAIVMSSIGAEAFAALDSRARAAGGTLVDAPILGNPQGAETGTLTIVASGAPDDVAAARPVFDAFASSIIDLGPGAGAGQVVKTVSQLLQIVGMLATIEAIELADARGVASSAVLEVLAATAPSWAVERWDYVTELWERRDPTTSLGIFAKDLAAALADADDAGVDLPVTAAAARVLDARLEPPG